MIRMLPEDLLLELREFIARNYEDERTAKCLTMNACMPCAPMPKPQTASLADVLRQADAGFSETLLKRIDEAGKKDADVYKRAGLSKQHFSKIRNNPNYRPTKATAVALAIALELDIKTTEDLLKRAGYALGNSSKFDLIVRFFIARGEYDILQINMALYEFDQPLLGGV